MHISSGLTAEGVRTKIEAAMVFAGKPALNTFNINNHSEINYSNHQKFHAPTEVYVHLMQQGEAKFKAADMAKELLPGMQKKILKVNKKNIKPKP